MYPTIIILIIFSLFSTKHFKQVSLCNKEMTVFTSRAIRRKEEKGNGMEVYVSFFFFFWFELERDIQ
jgi:hypothetical protein